MNLFKFISNLLPKYYTLNITHDSGAKNKPTIVLLHGIAATSGVWKTLINELNQEKYRIITMDLLGFGDSPKPTDCKYDVNDHVRSVHKTIKKLNIKGKFILIGHSMGSIISANYAKKYHWEIEKLFLLAPPVYLKKHHLKKKFSKSKTDFYMNAYNSMFANKEKTIKYSQSFRKILRIEDGIDVNVENWNAFRMSLKNTIINQNIYNDIRKLDIPVDVIYGQFDQFLVQESVNKLSSFSNVKVTRLIGVDHTVRKKFAKNVIQLLEE